MQDRNNDGRAHARNGGVANDTLLSEPPPHAPARRNDTDDEVAALHQKIATLEAELASRTCAEESLRHRAAQLTAFVENTSVGLHWVGPDGIIQWANKADCDLLGYAPEEYIGRNIIEFHADRHVIDDILARLTNGERLHDYEARLKAKDGSIKTVLIDSCVLWHEGKFVHTQCFTRDITRRKRVEEALAESRKELAVQVEDLQHLHERTVRLAGARRLSEVFNEVLHAALAVHKTACGTLATFDPDHDTLQIEASAGFSQEFLDTIRRVPPGVGACGTCFKQKRRIVIEDTETDPVFEPYRDAARLAGFRAVHSTPLVTRNGKIVGVLSVHFPAPRWPTRREMQLMDLYARFVADYVVETRLRETAANELADSKLLQSISAEMLCEQNAEALYKKLVDAAVAIMRSDYASMQAFYPGRGERGELHLVASHGFNDEAEKFWEWVGFDCASSCGEVLRSGRRVIVPEIEDCAFLAGTGNLLAYREAGIHAAQSTPLYARSGKLVGMISTHWRKPHMPSERDLRLFDILARQAADLLERKQSEDALRQSELRWRTLAETLPNLVWTDLPDGQCDWLSTQWGQYTGIPENELLGVRWLERVIHPDDRANTLARWQAACADRAEYDVEFRIRRYDGEYRWFKTRGVPVRDAAGKIIYWFGTCTDIQDVKEAEARERKLTENAARLAAIVEQSDDAIIGKDTNSIITSWNTGAERLFGFTASEAIGRPVTILFPPERMQEEEHIFERIRKGQRVDQYETVRRRKDGTHLDISLTVSPIKNPQNEVIGASTVARDITDKVRAKERLEQMVAERTAQLRETVSELEAFSYSVAHDMRAPLRAMNTYARMLRDDFKTALPAEALQFAERISSGATRLDALITDVLNYTKISRGEMELEPVDVERLTREIVDSYANLRESGATILVQSPIPAVIGNTAALTQCISNLLSNAVKFVAPNATPRVVIRAENIGELVRLWFEDNGIGISGEGQQRIFRMFQRLNANSQFEGTGIGLTIVRKAAQRMGGRVGVRSQPGVGSQFWIDLKRAT